MSIVADVQTEFGLLKQKFEALEAKFAPEVPKLAALEDNPVVDALLAALHVPASGLALVTNLINGLEEIYKPVEATDPVTTAPADASVATPPIAPVG